MASMARRGQALHAGSRAARRGQPRRKNSQSQQQPTRPRAGSKNFDGSDATDEHALDDLHPLRDAADRVGREVELFAEKLDQWNTSRREGKCSKREAAMGLVGDCKMIAQDTVKRLKRSHGRQLEARFRSEIQGQLGAPPPAHDIDAGESRLATTVEDLVEWQQELSVWELVEDLLEVHWPDDDRRLLHLKHPVSADTGCRSAKEKPYWDEFLISDNLAQERFLVLKWLERNADYSGRDVDILEEYLEETSSTGKGLWTQSWLYTREKIKGQKRLRLWDVPIDSGLPEIKSSEGSQLLITQLDPDAVTRQARILERQDVDFETAISKVCWYMVRRGTPAKKVIEWCQERNEFWRALTMGTSTFGPHCEDLEVERGFLWRRMCYAAAKDGFPNTFERAVLGFFGGDYDSVEPVCSDWTDYTFARYNALLLSQYEQFLVDKHRDLLPLHLGFSLASYDALNFNADPQRSGWNTQLALMGSADTGLDAANPFRVVLAYLLGHNFKNLLLHQGLLLGKRVSERRLISDLIQPMDPADINDKVPMIADNINSLRVLTHLFLIHQDLGLEVPTDYRQHAIENVLAEYIDFLRLAGKRGVIPLYASRLSKDRAEDTMARILTDITHPHEQSGQTKLMRAYDIDVIEVLTKQHEFAMQHSRLGAGFDPNFKRFVLLEHTDDPQWPGQRIMEGFTRQDVDADEMTIINSMEWFLLVEGHWALTFSALTDVCKTFLNFGRIGAANRLIEKLAVRRISYAKTLTMVGKQLDVMDDHEGSDDETTPPLGRSIRPRVRNVQVNARRALTPQKMKIHRHILKMHARTYFELSQLVVAMQALDEWSTLERSHMGLKPKHDTSTSEDPKKKEDLRAALDNLTATVEPLLGDVLVHAKDAQEAESLQRIRYAYLPDIVIGYHSALHSAGHLLTREHLLQCMDLATDVAESAELTECFTATGRMSELVDAFAMSSKAMLRLNEHLLGIKGKGKRRGRTGQTLGIWDVVE